MDVKGKEKGILKLEPRPRVSVDTKAELTPQGSCDRPLSSPQPSVDRLSVTWADPGSMTSSGVNLFHLPSDTPISNEIKFSPSGGDGSEDEDYSVSLSAVLRQRRASVRRSRKGRARRPSSPFLPDDSRSRRRSSVFTTSSGDTAISIDEQLIMTQEQIFENIHLHKEVLGSVKQQPLGMRRKLKIVHQAKGYIKRHEGQLQERLAQSKSTRDIYARFNILIATKWQQLKREAANTSNLLIPWESRIKEIESHFGSVVASYFTFLRWLFWVNLVIGFILLVFVIIPEDLTANPQQDGERKIIMDEERSNATKLLTLWEFEGVLKYSSIFYGYYSNVERSEYRMPLAYFLTGLIVYIYSFVAILRKMAENSRMSKLSEKDDECIFSWKLFTGWDFMIGNTETAHNRIASVILGFKEALLEEAEKKRNSRNWRILTLRAIVNICVIILLAVSAYAVVTVVSRTDDNTKKRSWWRENETTTVVTVISITFPVFFELLGYLEHYHPRKQLRLQLARIMLLNLLNLYSLIFALFSKIDGMSKELVSLQPTLNMNNTTLLDTILNVDETLAKNIPQSCVEVLVPCSPCYINNMPFNIKKIININKVTLMQNTDSLVDVLAFEISHNNTANIDKSKHENNGENVTSNIFIAENLIRDNNVYKESESVAIINETEILWEFGEKFASTETNDFSSEMYNNDSTNYNIFSSLNSETRSDHTISNDPFTKSNIDIELNFNSSTSTYFETGSDLSYSTEIDYEFNTTEMTTFLNDETEDIGSKFTNDSFSDSTNNEPETITSTGSEYSETVTSSESDDIKTALPSENEDIEIGITSESEDIEKVTSSESVTSLTSTTIKDITNTEKNLMNYDLTTDYNTLSVNKKNGLSYVYPTTALESMIICSNFSFNLSIDCMDRNLTQVIFISNCTIVDIKCYIANCLISNKNINVINNNNTNITMVDTVYIDNHRKMYNLTKATRKKLLKLCWETMFGQELVKLTVMDLVFVVLGTLFMDFFRALFVRYMNRFWCWDLEKRFPEYGDFKIAENILHLINNQGLVWMGMFFSPGLVVLNVVKLMIMMYLRSWAVMTCNVPHEVVFRVSKSNNFYLALLLTMLFLCVLPVGYTIVWVKPSWHCGPFSEYDKIYKILTKNIYKVLPTSLNFALELFASPAIVIPLLVVLILIIYYLISLTSSLREANNDLKIQLRRERTEERRKMFQLADTRRRTGSSSIDNTPFSRWKKALPSLPISKSIDSDDHKTIAGDEGIEYPKASKKKAGIFAKIVGIAIDNKCEKEISVSPKNQINDEMDADFHESLPKEILKIKDIIVAKNIEPRKKNSVEFKMEKQVYKKPIKEDRDQIKYDDQVELFEKNPKSKEMNKESKKIEDVKIETEIGYTTINAQSKLLDSVGSVIPVITISTTESDDEILQSCKSKEKNLQHIEKTGQKNKDHQQQQIDKNKRSLRKIQKCSDFRSLRRQSSVESLSEKQKLEGNRSQECDHKYQYSL